MKGKKRVLIVMLLLAAIFLSLSACGGNSSGAPADEPAGTADDRAKSTKDVDAKEHTPPEKRLKEVRIVADGTDAGALMYTYDDKGNPVRLETTDGLSDWLPLIDYEYDAEGRLTGVRGTDEEGNTAGLIFQYSQEDGITRAVLSLDEDGDGVPDEANEGFTFDADGYMLSLSRNYDGYSIEWTYDDAHRITEEYINYPSDPGYAYPLNTNTYTYDDNGNFIEGCSYYFNSDELLGGMLAGTGLRPDKSTATLFAQTTYSDLEFNDKGLLISADGETWDSNGGDPSDVSIDYTYDDEGNLLLEKFTSSSSELRDETTTYHSGNDACIVGYDKMTFYTNEYLSCDIFSDQFAFMFSSNSNAYFSAYFYFPYGGSIRFTQPKDSYRLDIYDLELLPALDLRYVFDFDDPESYLPENLEFTEDGYLSKLDYGAGNYVELLYE